MVMHRLTSFILVIICKNINGSVYPATDMVLQDFGALNLNMGFFFLKERPILLTGYLDHIKHISSYRDQPCNTSITVWRKVTDSQFQKVRDYWLPLSHPESMASIHVKAYDILSTSFYKTEQCSGSALSFRHSYQSDPFALVTELPISTELFSPTHFQALRVAVAIQLYVSEYVALEEPPKASHKQPLSAGMIRLSWHKYISRDSRFVFAGYKISLFLHKNETVIPILTKDVFTNEGETVIEGIAPHMPFHAAVQVYRNYKGKLELDQLFSPRSDVICAEREKIKPEMAFVREGLKHLFTKVLVYFDLSPKVLDSCVRSWEFIFQCSEGLPEETVASGYLQRTVSLRTGTLYNVSVRFSLLDNHEDEVYLMMFKTSSGVARNVFYGMLIGCCLWVIGMLPVLYNWLKIRRPVTDETNSELCATDSNLSGLSMQNTNDDNYYENVIGRKREISHQRHLHRKESSQVKCISVIGKTDEPVRAVKKGQRVSVTIKLGKI